MTGNSGQQASRLAGRPREFDETEVVMRATLAFWRHGYDATSTDMLVAATGLNPSSIYNSFGSKRGLYLTALDRYNALLSARLEPLLNGTKGIADIESFLTWLRGAKLKKDAIPGCMMASAMADGSTADPDVAARTNTYEDRIYQAFKTALDRAVALGELDDGAPEHAARILTTAMIGALAASRIAPPRIDDGFIGSMRAMLKQWRPGWPS